MEYQTIQYAVADAVATITLHRPDKLNAFTARMCVELIDAFDRVDEDDEVRAVIVTGSGRAFCAGADLGSGGGSFDNTGAGDKQTIDTHRDGGGLLTLRIYDCKKPVIAAINGAAVGVGITMTLAMDIRIGVPDSKIGFVFARRGIVPEAASSWFLTRAVGIQQAAEWAYTGRIFRSEEALAAGLLSRIVPADDLLSTARGARPRDRREHRTGLRRAHAPDVLEDARRRESAPGARDRFEVYLLDGSAARCLRRCQVVSREALGGVHHEAEPRHAAVLSLVEDVRHLAGALLACLLCGTEAFAIDPAKVVDLSHTFDDDTVYWPTDAQGFELETLNDGVTAGGWYYSANRFETAEHGGTHIDAPVHFAQGKKSVDEIPLSSLIGPLVVIDVTEAASTDQDYRVTVADLRAWEKSHGRLPEGAIVVMRSGWSRRWPDRAKVLGTDRPGDTENLHFPGFSKEAATFLVEERDVNAVGVDTPSIDHGPSKDFIVHQIVNGADKPGLENLANLEAVPESGATILALPMKIRGGSGAPVRAIAVLP